MDYIDIIEKSIYNIDSKICGIIDDYRVLQEPQKVADYVIQFLRTYLEHIAARIYAYENPNEQVPIRGKDKWYTQYMKQLKESNEYGYIWRMHHSLQISTSHYVPAEDGAIRLMDGYLPQLYHLRDQMRDKFGLLLLSNFEDYPQEKSCELDSYYEKIYIALKAIDLEDSKEHTNDRYYITRKKYRTVNGKGFFEYTLSYAQEEITKFDRFVAYSFNDIPDNYSIQCDFSQSNIDFNGVGIDIKCLIAWNVAIRPCELEKLARICGYDIVVKSDNLYYKALMKFLSRTGMNLLDILLADNEEYEIYIQQIELKGTIFSMLRGVIPISKIMVKSLNDEQKAKQIQLTDFQVGSGGICKMLYFNNGIKVKEYIMEINKMTYSHLNLDIVLELNDIDSVDKEYVAYSETVRGFGNMYPKIYFSSDEKIIITKVK